MYQIFSGPNDHIHQGSQNTTKFNKFTNYTILNINNQYKSIQSHIYIYNIYIMTKCPANRTLRQQIKNNTYPLGRYNRVIEFNQQTQVRIKTGFENNRCSLNIKYKYDK